MLIIKKNKKMLGSTPKNKIIIGIIINEVIEAREEYFFKGNIDIHINTKIKPRI